MSNDFQKKQIVKAFVDIYFDLLSTIKEQLENKNAEKLTAPYYLPVV